MIAEKDFRSHLEQLLGQRITNFHSLSGGDISQVVKIEVNNKSYVVKSSWDEDALQMYMAEKEGLSAINDRKTIKAPSVIQCGNWKDSAFIVLDFINTKNADAGDFIKLAQELAALHRSSATQFGWANSNFIGSIRQKNKWHNDWIEFYVSQRLSPQLEIAQTKNLLSHQQVPGEDILISQCKNLCQDVNPALLHGDLWSGNYLIADDGQPYLIDPAVYFGHNEVDIAMTKLFGGFSTRFYDVYFDEHPPQPGIEDRIAVYQLYYLLVHLNIFGTSYRPAVTRILRRYFG